MTFVDIGAWFASVVPEDVNHDSAVRWLAENREPLLTSDYVVDETLTLLKSRHQPDAARKLGRLLFGGGEVEMRYLTPLEIQAARKVF